MKRLSIFFPLFFQIGVFAQQVKLSIDIVNKFQCSNNPCVSPDGIKIYLDNTVVAQGASSTFVTNYGPLGNVYNNTYTNTNALPSIIKLEYGNYSNSWNLKTQVGLNNRFNLSFISGTQQQQVTFSVLITPTQNSVVKSTILENDGVLNFCANEIMKIELQNSNTDEIFDPYPNILKTYEFKEVSQGTPIYTRTIATSSSNTISYTAPSPSSSQILTTKYNVELIGNNWNMVAYGNNQATIYHAKPKIVVSDIYSNCDGQTGFNVSISGVLNNYRVRLYNRCVVGENGKCYTDFMFREGLDITDSTKNLWIAKNGVIHIDNFTVRPAGSPTTQLPPGNYRLAVGNQYPSGTFCQTYVDFDIPYPEFDWNLPYSFEKKVYPNGTNVSCHGARDGEVTIVGDAINFDCYLRIGNTIRSPSAGYPFGTYVFKNIPAGEIEVVYLDARTECTESFTTLFTAPNPNNIQTNVTPLRNCISNPSPGNLQVLLRRGNDPTVLGMNYNFNVYARVGTTTSTIASNVSYGAYNFPTTVSGDYTIWAQNLNNANCTITNNSHIANMPNSGNFTMAGIKLHELNGYNVSCPGFVPLGMEFTLAGFNYSTIAGASTAAVYYEVPSSAPINYFSSGCSYLDVPTRSKLKCVGNVSKEIYLQDHFGCGFVYRNEIKRPSIPTISGFSQVTPNTCHDSQNSIVQVTIAGGVPPFNSFDIYSTSLLSGISKGTQSQAIGINTFTGLGQGYYSFSLGKDAHNCVYAAATVPSGFLVKSPAPVSYVPFANDVICKGDSSGSILPATLTGGNGGYYSRTYNELALANLIATTAGIGKLSGGTYRVYMYDKNGCNSIPVYRTVNIVEPNMALSVSVFGTAQGSSCYERNDGELSFRASGGWTGGYAFESAALGHSNRNKEVISSTVNSSNFKALQLSRGFYVASVKDSKGCVRTVSGYLPSPDSMRVSVTKVSNPKCNGDANGFFSLTATGGNGNYRYAHYNDGFTRSSNLFEGLRADTFAIHAKDTLGCQSVFVPYILSEPSILKTHLIDTIPSACQQAIGGITMSGTGGVSPYKFTWNDTPSYYSTFTRKGIKAGIYITTLTDANMCKSVSNISLRDREGPKVMEAFTQPASCVYKSDGMVQVLRVVNGEKPFRYNWSGAAVGSDSAANNLPVDIYSVSVTDANGCVGGQTFEINSPPRVTGRVQSTIHPSCEGGENGRVVISATGGAGALRYKIAGKTELSNIPAFNNLKAGMYTIDVEDKNGCTATGMLQARLLNPPKYEWKFATATASICPGQRYVIQSPQRAEAYSWEKDNEVLGNSPNLTIRNAGNYKLTCTSEMGCQASDEFKVNENISSIETKFLIRGEGYVGDTLVAIEISWPKPDSISWSIPSAFTVWKYKGDYAYLICNQAGEFDISVDAFLGTCGGSKTKRIKILEQAGARENEGEWGLYKGAKEVIVYPNPTDRELSLKALFSYETNLELKIQDIVGTKVWSKSIGESLKEHTQNIDISHLPSGLYLLTVSNESYKKVIKVIRE